jgi:hypothetical protein
MISGTLGKRSAAYARSALASTLRDGGVTVEAIQAVDVVAVLG